MKMLIPQLFEDIPQVDDSGHRIRRDPSGKHQKSLEHGSSIPAGKFSLFSDDFRPIPVGKHRKLTGIHRKKSEQFPVGILLPCSSDFRCFPAGSGDFPASFLHDPAGSGGRNHRSRLKELSQ
jgi:hypothetical protein